jgi:MoxR-like ATPase
MEIVAGGAALPPPAADRQTPFSRTLPVPHDALDPVRLGPEEKLRILLARASPSDIETFESLDLAPIDPAEIEGVATFLQREAGAALEIETLGGADCLLASLDAIDERIEKARAAGRPFHVLHLICHGLKGGPSVPAALVLPLGGGDARAVRVSEDEIAECLGPRARAGAGPWVVTLASCWTARDAQEHALKGVARRLLLYGVPAVAAMQQRLSVAAAEVFARQFYLSLVADGRPDLAMNAAREALWRRRERASLSGIEHGMWAVPVLFQRYDRRPLFERTGTPAAGSVATAAREAAARDPEPIPYEQLASADPEGMVRGLLRPVAAALPVSGSGMPSLTAIQSLVEAMRRADPVAEEERPPEPYRLKDDPLLASPRPRMDLSGFDPAARDAPDGLPPLQLPPRVGRQLATALKLGRHVILTGPPGTGKTSLAVKIAAFARSQGYCAGGRTVTASVDWTTFDTLGGNVPERGGALRFRPGLVTAAVQSGEWLIIDEINRAEIDKAFGELFTLLSGQRVSLSYTVGGRRVRLLPPGDDTFGEGHDFLVHPHWRLIGTMNVYDKASLFSMSAALKRRFAFIDVPLPDPPDYDRILTGFYEDPVLQGDFVALNTLLADDEHPVRRIRGIGPALARDIVAYLKERPETAAERMADVVSLFLLPQWEGLEEPQVQAISRALEALQLADGDLRWLRDQLCDMYPYFARQQIHCPPEAAEGTGGR